MATIAPPAAPSSVDLLDQVVASEQGREIQRRLQRRYRSLSAEYIDDAYQSAYEDVRDSCSLRGTTPAEVGRYFATSVERRLLMALRRREHEVPTEREALLEHASDLVADDDYRQVDLRPMVHEIADTLCERQRGVLVLYCHDKPRREIADRLNISQKRAKKDLEDILAKGRRLLAGKAGGGCDEGHKLVTALAFGVLHNQRDLATANEHLAACADCGQLYERLEMFRDAAAAMLPLPAGDAAANSGVIERTTQKLADAATAAKQHLADATSQTKLHATNVYARAADPTPLAGARPGTVGAVLASCVAVGSGAAYCTQQGLNPIRGLAGAKTEQADKKPAKPKPRKAQADTSPPPPVIPPPDPAATTPAPTPAADPPAPVTPAPTPEVDPAQQGGSTRQFDPGAAASPAQAAPAPQPTQPSTPAPASGGEFSGP